MKKRKDINTIGIWMDHQKATLINPLLINPLIKEIHANTTERRTEGETADKTKVGHFFSTNNEYKHHQREENELRRYFKTVATAIKTYKTVYVFGPTTAPDEFCNFLLKQKAFSGKTIISEKEDYLNPNEAVELVRNFIHSHRV